MPAESSSFRVIEVLGAIGINQNSRRYQPMPSGRMHDFSVFFTDSRNDHCGRASDLLRSQTFPPDDFVEIVSMAMQSAAQGGIMYFPADSATIVNRLLVRYTGGLFIYLIHGKTCELSLQSFVIDRW